MAYRAKTVGGFYRDISERVREGLRAWRKDHIGFLVIRFVRTELLIE